MGQEIERKFLVRNYLYRNNSEPILYRQAYLSSNEERVVRIRLVGQKGYITIKGLVRGCMRLEFEYEIPYNDAQAIIDTICEKPIIEKYRYKVEYDGFIWEVDEFLGANEGLIIAEIELHYENQHFSIPSWIGEEVTNDIDYYNSNLVKKPYKCWDKRV